jgi:hypothetical protein
MEVKLLELCDDGTFIPLLCVDMNPTSDGCYDPGSQQYDAQRYLLRRCGYPCDGRPNIAITHLSADGDRCSNDPYFWGDRTRATAHKYIIEHWAELSDGDVVDVEFILGETKQRKVSERESAPL